MMKTVVVLEETEQRARGVDVLKSQLPRGWKVKGVKEAECDHPNTKLRSDKSDGCVVITETCMVCGESDMVETGEILESREEKE